MQRLLPAASVALLAPFAPLFSRPVWRQIPVLLVGTILSPGQRTVSAALRAGGLSHLPTFPAYHRVLNRAVWSSPHSARPFADFREYRSADDPFAVDHMPKTKSCCRSVAGRRCC